MNSLKYKFNKLKSKVRSRVTCFCVNAAPCKNTTRCQREEEVTQMRLMDTLKGSSCFSTDGNNPLLTLARVHLLFDSGHRSVRH